MSLQLSISSLTGMRLADEVIKRLDPRRDTEDYGVTSALLSSIYGTSTALLSSMLRCLSTFYTYLSSNHALVMFVYLCILCLSTIYIAGFGRMLEEMKITTTITPRINVHPRTQKGRWRTTLQGFRRPYKRDPIFYKRK